MPHEAHPPDPDRFPLLSLCAQRQGGALATRQIHAAGVTATELRGLARRRLLVREHQGVWRLGTLTPDGRLWAARLAMGPKAVISLGASGAEHAVLKRHRRDHVDVTTPTRRRKRRGITPHEAVLQPPDIVTRRGLRFTSLSRTLLDLAAVLPKAGLDGAVDEARYQDKLHVPTVEAAIARATGHHGIGRLRASIARHAPGRGLPRGEQEKLLSRFLAERGYPRHERNALVEIDGEMFTVDVLFPVTRVVLEFDSRQFHDTDPRFESDRRRIRRFAAGGWKLVPLTSTDLKERADELDADLRAILDQ